VKLEHRFVVAAPPEAIWAAFDDLEGVAPCLPGATLTSVDGDEFSGTVKVKLGPISMVYSGTGRFVERDRDAGRVVVEAKGKDKRGNGTAGATVVAHIVADGDRTAVELSTDLAVTGKPAQFGRGVIQEVSDKLLGQFVDCFSARLASPTANTAGEPDAAAESASDAAPAAEPDAAPAAEAEDASPASPPPSSSLREPAARPAPRPTPPPPTAELDLVSTVLPVIVRRYAPALAFVGGLLLGLLLRRRR